MVGDFRAPVRGRIMSNFVLISELRMENGIAQSATMCAL